MVKQLFFKLKGQRLISLSERQQRKFAANSNIDINDKDKNQKSFFIDGDEDEVFVSFSYDKTIEDYIVFIWAGNFSISLSHKEFMGLYHVFNNKDIIEQMIVAHGI